MTVGELIEKLKAFDSDKNVRIMDDEGELVLVDIVCKIDDSHRPNSNKHGDILLFDAEWNKGMIKSK